MKVYRLNELYHKFYSETEGDEGDEKTKSDAAAVSALKAYQEQGEELETFTFHIKLSGEPRINTYQSSGKEKRYYYSAFGYDDEDNKFFIIFPTLSDGYSKDINWDDAHVSTYPSFIKIPKFFLIK